MGEDDVEGAVGKRGVEQIPGGEAGAAAGGPGPHTRLARGIAAVDGDVVPRLDQRGEEKLIPIEGLPPNLINMPPTCAFLPRCPYKIDKCAKEVWPPLTPVDGDEKHQIRCYVDTKTKEARQ